MAAPSPLESAKARGNAAYKEGRFDDAKDAYLDAIAIADPEQADVLATLHHNLGRVYIESTNQKQIHAIIVALSRLGAEIVPVAWNYPVNNWTEVILNQLCENTQFRDEFAQRADDPLLQPAYEGPHVLAALVQVQHHIGHALTGSVIGELPAPAAAMDREPGCIQQVAVLRRDPGGIERGMLQQPDQLAGLARRDRCRPGLHQRHRRVIVDIALRDRPFGRAAIGANQFRDRFA
jgi:hypothetical protein